MFKQVIRVEKVGENELVLHGKKGKPLHLGRALSLFRFEGREVTLRTRADFQSKARTHDGQDIGGFTAAAEYMRTQGANLFFDVTSSTATYVISFNARCDYTVYGFKGETFIGPYKSIKVDVQSGSPSRSILHTLTDEEGDFSPQCAPLLRLEVVLAEEQFRLVCSHLWIGPTPSIVTVIVSLPCFERPGAALAPRHLGSHVVAEADQLFTAWLEAVHVEKPLGRVVTTAPKIDTPDAAEPDTWNRGSRDALGKDVQETARYTKRILLIVAAAAGFVIISTLLKW
jgi:hypothetical protein